MLVSLFTYCAGLFGFEVLTFIMSPWGSSQGLLFGKSQNCYSLRFAAMKSSVLL